MAVDAAQTAGIVVVAVAALRMAEVALSRSFSKRNGNNNGTARIVRLLESINKSTSASVLNTDKLIEMHDVKDQNGVYSWMLPREWGHDIKAMAKEFRDHEAMEMRLIRELQVEQKRCSEKIDRLGGKQH